MQVHAPVELSVPAPVVCLAGNGGNKQRWLVQSQLLNGSESSTARLKGKQASPGFGALL
jgi:hypothetical protein